MRTIILVLLMAFTEALTASAQWYGFAQFGPSLNTVSTNIGNRPLQEYQPGYGVSMGMGIENHLPLWKKIRIAVGSGFYYTQKSYSITRKDRVDALNLSFRNGYFEIPMYLNIFLQFKRVSIFSSFGIYGGYWVSGHIKGGIANIINVSAPYPAIYPVNESYSFNNIRDRRFEFGWLTGLGVSYNTSKYNFLLRVAVSPSSTDMQKDYMRGLVPKYNQTSSLLFGILKRL